MPSASPWRPTALHEDQGMWIGPQASVSYPAGGHSILPGSLGNWWYGHRARTAIALAERYRRTPRVLWDIGGGTGLMARAFKQAGWSTALVEPMPGAARQAIGVADTVFSSQLGDLSLPDGSVPNIGLFDVIEHLDDPVALLSECRRVLAPGGTIIVTVPALPRLWSATDDVAGHKRRYTKRAMAMQASQAGLRAIHQEYFFALLALGILPIRLIGDRRRSQESSDAVLEREARLLNPNRRVNAGLRAVLLVEDFVGRLVPFPAGLSLAAVLMHSPEGAGAPGKHGRPPICNQGGASA